MASGVVNGTPGPRGGRLFSICYSVSDSKGRVDSP